MPGTLDCEYKITFCTKNLSPYQSQFNLNFKDEAIKAAANTSKQSGSYQDSLIESIKRRASWSLLSHVEFWLCQYLVDPAMFFLPIIIGAILTFPSLINYSIPLIIITIIAYILHYRQNRRVKAMEGKLIELTSENSQLKINNAKLDEDLAASIRDMKSLCQGYLYLLAEGPLGFGASNGSHERITLYAHDSSGQFFAIGRYSRQPIYRETGRFAYPGNQGVIAKTWENGWWFENDFPDPTTNKDGYHQRCMRDGLTEDVIKDLGMPSRLYYGYRISNTQGRDPIAVIITESTDPHRYDEISLKALFEEKEREYLRDLAEQLLRWMPNLKEAKEKGF